MRSVEAIKRERTQVRNELSFLHDDHGGPDREAEKEQFRVRLRELEVEMNAALAATRRVELEGKKEPAR